MQKPTSRRVSFSCCFQAARDAGYDLRSNIVSGLATTVDINDKVTPLDRVLLMVRSRGAKLGAIRTRFRVAVRRRCQRITEQRRVDRPL
ncbi:hypothetical protein [Bradyrhizobium sp.]|uniref:hypothetical protein n=1 Tax=Bradyrhizobium sp. TaxID=376 RepID=UPI002D0C158A|nr:hypothetical protein [Bradyrhizobium sp.]HMM92784.1 hypothetical protein [Bradyrhizobium sp.]